MSFSSYLVGTWENHGIQRDRPAAFTSIQIVYPIARPESLYILVVFLDEHGNYLQHVEKPLKRNAMWEIPVANLQDDRVQGKGVVKIFSLNNPYRQGGQLQEGIIGFQRQALAGVFPTSPPDPEAAFSEAPLAAIPREYAEDEWQYMRSQLP
jgi:hypothetical protein